MELRRDLLIGIGALVAFNILVSFGTIGLLVRMSPAIERILQENVYSIQAAEDMLSVVARSERRPAGADAAGWTAGGAAGWTAGGAAGWTAGGAAAGDDGHAAMDGLDGLGGQPQAAAARAWFAEALERARSNVTEDSERPVLARIDKSWRAALEGEPGARTEVVDALELLVRINREAMSDEDIEAQRLGMAGAWSAVFIAVFGFALSFAVTRRLRRRILTPLAELYGVLETARAGDFYRRCRSVDAPLEIRRIFHVVNQLLDRQSRELERSEPVHGLDRVLLVHMLEQQAEPAFMMDGRGQLLAANTRGLARLAEAGGEQVRQALTRVAEEAGQALTRVAEEAGQALARVAAEAGQADGRGDAIVEVMTDIPERLRAVPVAGGKVWHCTLQASGLEGVAGGARGAPTAGVNG